jgi:NADPH:quinone reductase-like Zn-dependent oxidoreductase
VIRDAPLPVPTPGTARIRTRAFGVNHAEMVCPPLPGI